MMKKWTQKDLWFWKNKGLKRSQNNMKGGQQEIENQGKMWENEVSGL